MADPQETVELEKTPGGWRGKLSGQNIFLIFASVCFGIAGWVLIDHRNESRAAIAEMTAKHEKALGRVAEAIEKQTESQEASQYIFTLSPEERQRLRLDMPESLRRRSQR
jgi:hypothetical protein